MPPTHSETSPASVYMLAGLLVAGVLALQGYLWYLDEDWLRLGLLAAGVGGGAAGLIALVRRLTDRPFVDRRLVQEKVSRSAYLAELRLAVSAPAESPPAQLTARLANVTAAYRQFNLPAGNGFLMSPLRLGTRAEAVLSTLQSAGRKAVLNARERCSRTGWLPHCR